MLGQIAKMAKDAWNDPFQRMLALVIAVGAAYAFAFSATIEPLAPQQYGGNATLDVDFFYHPACPHCKEQMPYNQELAREFPGAKWVYRDTSDPAQNELMGAMLKKLGKEKKGVPTTIINGTVIVGFDRLQTPQLLRNALSENGAGNASKEDETAQKKTIAVPFFGEIDPYQYSLPVLSITLGLIDGFNPCAMWVLVYLISITLTLNDRKKFLLIVGTFLFASGALYFFIMAAWLNAFLFLGYVRPVMIGVGAIALYWGISSLREFWKNKGEISCKVENPGEKKKLASEIEALLSSPLSLATFAGLLVLAFTINSIEFVCSSAIPAVFTQVLSLSSLSQLEHYGYILLYVIMYMLDDIVVFSLAFWAAGGMLGNRIASWGHAIGAFILIGLGLMLLFAPQLLMA
jgi:thiol-disulfide isomerase/thioredoxin